MQGHIHNLGEPGDKQAGILSKNTVLLGVWFQFLHTFRDQHIIFEKIPPQLVFGEGLKMSKQDKSTIA